MSVILVEFTDKINRIIKSKWEILEELEISLPTVFDVKTKLISDNLDSIIKSIIFSNYDSRKKYEKVYIFTNNEEDGSVSLNYASKSGPKTIAYFIVESSVKFPNAAKKVNIEFVYPEEKDVFTIKDIMDNIADKNADADIVHLYLQLPEKDKQKEHNMVCPKCNRRYTMYVGSFNDRQYYAMTCGNCDFVGKKRLANYEVPRLWTEREFSTALKQIIKENRFIEAKENFFKSLETNLEDLKKLKQNKKVAYTNEYVQNLRIITLKMVNDTFDYLEKR